MSSSPYTPQAQVGKGKVALLPFSSPAALERGNGLHVFYNGIGNDGFWVVSQYSQYLDQWYPPTSVKKGGAKSLMPFPGTTPSPIVFQNETYIWYTNINLEIYGVRALKGSNYDTWGDAFSIWGKIGGDKKTIAPPTSINTVVYKGLLYFFWVYKPGYAAINQIQYATFDGYSTWSDAQNVASANMGVKPGTSASVNVFKDVLYVFYDGSGDDGTWVAAFKEGKWEPVKSMASALGWFGQVDFTDPDSWTSTDGKTEVVSNGSFQGSWVATTTDAKSWEKPINIAKTIGTQGIAVGSSARGTSYLNRTHIFWNGIGEGGLFYTRQNIQPKILEKEEVEEEYPGNTVLPTPDMILPATAQTVFRPYSDIDEKRPFDLPVSESVPNLDDRVRAKGLLPTVREVKRYGWIGAILRKYLGFAGRVMLVLIALVLMTLMWHYVSPACAHNH